MANWQKGPICCLCFSLCFRALCLVFTQHFELLYFHLLVKTTEVNRDGIIYCFTVCRQSRRTLPFVLTTWRCVSPIWEKPNPSLGWPLPPRSLDPFNFHGKHELASATLQETSLLKATVGERRGGGGRRGLQHNAASQGTDGLK